MTILLYAALFLAGYFLGAYVAIAAMGHTWGEFMAILDDDSRGGGND